MPPSGSTFMSDCNHNALHWMSALDYYSKIKIISSLFLGLRFTHHFSFWLTWTNNPFQSKNVVYFSMGYILHHWYPRCCQADNTKPEPLLTKHWWNFMVHVYVTWLTATYVFNADPAHTSLCAVNIIINIDHILVNADHMQINADSMPFNANHMPHNTNQCNHVQINADLLLITADHWQISQAHQIGQAHQGNVCTSPVPELTLVLMKINLRQADNSRFLGVNDSWFCEFDVHLIGE